MLLAARLRTAHQRIAPLPRDTRQRLHRQLLAITDLAKRDHELAARRLAAFLADTDLPGGTDHAGAAATGADGAATGQRRDADAGRHRA